MIKFPHLEKFVVEENRSIKEVLRIINLNAKGFVIVVDKQLFFRGLITDGDIRRAILKNSNLKRKIKFLLKKSFFLDKSSSVIKINTFLKKKRYIPILDKKKLIGLYIFNKEMLQTLICDTVIFAGGKGIRMCNLTKNIPKPLLKIIGKLLLDGKKKHLIIVGYVINLYISIVFYFMINPNQYHHQ